MNGQVVISLDFELAWGLAGWDIQQINTYKTNLQNAKKALYQIVKLLEKYELKCTIGFVGAMDYASISEVEENAIIPSYADKRFSSFLSLLSEAGKGIETDLLLAKDEIDFLRLQKNVELASHTYSHYYCLEEGQSFSDFEKDIARAKEQSQKRGIELKSIIFPRNQVNDDYLEICKKYGFTHFRGTLNNRFYRPSKTSSRFSPLGALRFLDTYLNLSGDNTFLTPNTKGEILIDIPGSRFLRPYSSKLFFIEDLKLRRIKRSMRNAAKQGRIYHLWWHPHNYGANMNENLEQLDNICQYFVILREKYNYTSSFMSEII